MSVTISNPSITHTFGNVACVAMDYMEHLFPDDWFKTKHITTKLANRQLDVFKKQTGFWKNKKPMLILRPRIDLNDSSVWYYGSAMMNRMTNSRSTMEFADLVPLVHHADACVDIQFIWNRFRLIFDVVIVVDTYNKQINIANDIRNQLNIDAPYPLTTFLEAYIPKSIIYRMADYLHIERTDTAQILDFLNTYSATPITYKLKNSSGNDEFFMMYQTNIESIVSDVSLDDGESRGIVSDTYTIALSLSLEFNAVGVWYLFQNDGNDNYNRIPIDDELSGDNIIPIVSIPLGYNLRLDHGWKIYDQSFYHVSTNKDNDPDITDISTILESNGMKKLLHHLDHNNIPHYPYLRFRCFKDGKELSRGKDGFEIDLKKKCIYTYNPEPHHTYRLFTIVNSLDINNAAAEIIANDNNLNN